MSKKKSRLKKRKPAKRKRRTVGETVMGVGGALAATSAVPYLFGNKAAGDKLLGGGLGLAGAGLGIGVLESVGEGLQKTGRSKKRKK